MYVGRTHPETTEEDIRSLVIDYTKSEDKPDGVIVSDVDILAEMKDQRERVVSKCWCISFPFADKELMMQASSWPAGWTYRQYFPSRKAAPLHKSESTTR